MIGDFHVSFINSCNPIIFVSILIYWTFSKSSIHFNFEIRVSFGYDILLIKVVNICLIVYRISALLYSTNKLNNWNVLENISKNKERIVGMTDFSFAAFSQTTDRNSTFTVFWITIPLFLDVFHNFFILKLNTGEILEKNSSESSSTVFSFGTSSSCKSQPNIYIESTELSFFSEISISSLDFNFFSRVF